METKKNKNREESSQLNLFFEQTIDYSSTLAKDIVKDNSTTFNNCFLRKERTAKIINFSQVLEKKVNEERQKTINHILNNVKRF